MIAGGFRASRLAEASEDTTIKIDQIFDQLSSETFAPLSSLPSNHRQHHKDDQVYLTQQSIESAKATSLARCRTTGQVCVSWSRLDNTHELEYSAAIESESKNNISARILACYQHWSTECPKYIQGDFVFAIYDPLARRLLLARDRMGARPLYYSEDAACFLFASNAAAIANLDAVDNRLSTSWLAQYLYKHYLDDSSTGFENIKKLPAGHALTVTQQGALLDLTVWEYWRLEELIDRSQHSFSPLGYVKDYRRHFDNAVGKRVTADSLMGIELSGGLDSSSIMVALMEQLSESSVHCFSRSYFTLETEPIRALHTCYPNSVKHIWKTPEENSENYHDNLRRYIKRFGLPDEHSLAIGCSNFLKVANKNDVRIMLSGYGGDEFSTAMGYDVLRQLAAELRFFALFSRLGGKPHHRLRKGWKLLFGEQSRNTASPTSLLGQNLDLQAVDEHRRSFYDLLREQKNHNLKMIQTWRQAGAQRLESHTLAGSAYGVSFRWPLLDEDLLSCFFSTPITERLGRGYQTRWLHRRALADCLPEIISNKNDKNIGELVNKLDPYDTFMKQFSAEIELHPVLQSMVDEKVLSQFLTNPSGEQKTEFMYRYTYKSIYSLNLWLEEFF